ncbi:MAG: PSP1 domain-containing protein [Anaerovoracaceae bacterium]
MRDKTQTLQLCKERILAHELEMKLIDAEIDDGNNKITFFFMSEGRVDFRELVKDLASNFKCRIELRQVGTRDEAKLLGGVGHCGKGLCCSTWLPDFTPVSIKMAKTQNLSLNPTKISGICGRLMCCLKFENELYKELRQGMPSMGDKVETEMGNAIVVEPNILQEKVGVRLIVEEESEENDWRSKLESEVIYFTKEEVKKIPRKKK